MNEPLDLSVQKCGSASFNSEKPKKNISLKSSKRLLPCKICNKNFDRPSLLKRHSRTHTGNFILN